MNLGFVDEVRTSDDYILEKIKTHDVFEIGYEEKQKLTEKITSSFSMLLNKLLAKLMSPV
ncbi:hypothetical protein [Candidatus Berkiella aquae]|uniref:Putative inner membrane peptidase n=1 Tax=Candidatus Berkiella aquae TaxID=295108 RepID=A0A0Q9YLF0_9GAMM|nr:hypothetical protein [Candidatus Berkiella aquae]MCS5711403.1 hypothetical protein [Candidatus Berkiella aquae]